MSKLECVTDSSVIRVCVVSIAIIDSFKIFEVCDVDSYADPYANDSLDDDSSWQCCRIYERLKAISEMLLNRIAIYEKEDYHENYEDYAPEAKFVYSVWDSISKLCRFTAHAHSIGGYARRLTNDVMGRYALIAEFCSDFWDIK